VKLATIRVNGGTRAVKADGDQLVDLGHDDLGGLLNSGDWAIAAASATGAKYPLDGAEFALVVPHSSKVIGVGLNYRSHIEEMGRDRSKYTPAPELGPWLREKGNPSCATRTSSSSAAASAA